MNKRKKEECLILKSFTLLIVVGVVGGILGRLSIHLASKFIHELEQFHNGFVDYFLFLTSKPLLMGSLVNVFMLILILFGLKHLEIKSVSCDKKEIQRLNF